LPGIQSGKKTGWDGNIGPKQGQGNSIGQGQDPFDPEGLQLTEGGLLLGEKNSSFLGWIFTIS
jgi:hypothetical protein